MYVEKYSGAKPVAEATPEKAAEAPEMPDTEASTEAAEEQPKVKTQEDIDRESAESHSPASGARTSAPCQ